MISMTKSPLLSSFLVLVFFLCQTNGYEVGVYKLKRGDFSVKLTNYGATVLSVMVPDRKGKLEDIVLGYDTVDDYKNDKTYFGATVGRVANRIKGAQFTLNGTKYHLTPNEGKNILHGGPKGYSRVIWTVQSYKKDSHVTFTYNSHHGEEGFPGNLSVTVRYSLSDDYKLLLTFKAKALNKATPVNLAHHAYWNLGGHNSGHVLSHTIKIYGSSITPVDDQLIPTGKIMSIKGTPYDFLEPRCIGDRINELPNGYDINYVLDKPKYNVELRKAAMVHEGKSGRKMELWTNAPGLQFYTSGLLDNEKGKDGFVYTKNAGLCLETQGFPDAVNHPNFPSQIINPGETYKHVMLYKFSA